MVVVVANSLEKLAMPPNLVGAEIVLVVLVPVTFPFQRALLLPAKRHLLLRLCKRPSC